MDTFLLEESKELCSICIEIIQEDYVYFKCINCKQLIHIHCLFSWFIKKKQRICPFCEKQINYFSNKNLLNINPEYFHGNPLKFDNDANALLTFNRINNDFNLKMKFDKEIIKTEKKTDNYSESLWGLIPEYLKILFYLIIFFIIILYIYKLFILV